MMWTMWFLSTVRGLFSFVENSNSLHTRLSEISGIRDLRLAVFYIAFLWASDIAHFHCVDGLHC